ncbi:hypothetical protein J7K93_10010 [bacterium]|nr:hypothetical protein [bacterium]
MDNKDKSKYYLGFIFWDTEDKRVFVPKRFGVGWTFNFANQRSIIILFATIVVCIYLCRFLH